MISFTPSHPTGIPLLILPIFFISKFIPSLEVKESTRQLCTFPEHNVTSIKTESASKPKLLYRSETTIRRLLCRISILCASSSVFLICKFRTANLYNITMGYANLHKIHLSAVQTRPQMYCCRSDHMRPFQILTHIDRP